MLPDVKAHVLPAVEAEIPQVSSKRNLPKVIAVQ